MYYINMLSKADSVEGQGVLSAYLEQKRLVSEGLKDEFRFVQNSKKNYKLTHYHTINPEFYLRLCTRPKGDIAIGSVHFLPETLENSISLPKSMKKVFYSYVIDFYKRMDYLVTVNPLFIDYLEKYGVDREKITFIPNYVSKSEFYEIENESKEALREKLGLPEKGFLVLAVGQLQTRKGVLDFIEIARAMPQVHFVWAGDFSFGIISEGQKEIKQALEELPDNAHFLGLVKRNQMNELYNAADVLFQPSYEELFPMTILEAMNTRTPLLLRDLEEYKVILEDFYLKGTSNEEFISKIKLLQNDDLYAKYQKKSEEGSILYSKEHVSEEWKDFYRRVASETKWI